MADQTNDTAAQLAALLAQMQASGATATAAPSAWSKPAAPSSAPAEILGVSVPISIETPVGKVRVYLNFPGTAASSPTALLGLIEQLSAAGLPLDAWKPREESSGGSWGGNRNGGSGSGWNRDNNRGGWRR